MRRMTITSCSTVSTMITIGSAASDSCAGDAGVPHNVRASFVSEATIQFTWEKPQCDESYGPIDGYEYTFWNVETDTQPQTASYIGRNTVALNDLEPGSRYAFRVRSRAGHGHSSWSDIVHAETEAHSGSLGKLYRKISNSFTGKADSQYQHRHRHRYRPQLTKNNTLLAQLSATPTLLLQRVKRQQKSQITGN
ncbi:unnamed protein product [Gongylonema pulchrum]|uniref:Fibronectin type-III domain-containing protein n=1 Tax=Gongylonema pulchrum TaxID=637853 RepID=A0A183EPS2_9BILA|nr:unnamed protein product [Gongylonema pulchrum]